MYSRTSVRYMAPRLLVCGTLSPLRLLPAVPLLPASPGCCLLLAGVAKATTPEIEVTRRAWCGDRRRAAACSSFSSRQCSHCSLLRFHTCHCIRSSFARTRSFARQPPRAVLRWEEEGATVERSQAVDQANRHRSPHAFSRRRRLRTRSSCSPARQTHRARSVPCSGWR